MKTHGLRMSLLLMCLGLTGCAGRLFYHPTSRLYTTPDQVSGGMPWEDVHFESADGTRLHGWWLPAQGEAKGVVVHCHGNAQNLSSHWAFVHWLPGTGYHLFVFDYRGYGQSDGRVTRSGTIADTQAALAYVRTRPEAGELPWFVLGQSLGGAVAVTALAEGDFPEVKGVVVDSAFSSYRLIVREKMAYIPVVGWFRWPLSFLVVSNRLSPEPRIHRLSPTPVLILHGTDDRVIPPHHGQRLYRAARPPKELLLTEGTDHTEAIYEPEVRERILRFFEEAAAPEPASLTANGRE